MKLDRIIAADAPGASSKGATPIFKVRTSALEEDLASAPGDLADLARLNGFAGRPGAVLRHDEAALLGVGDGSDPFVVAAAAAALTAGDYMFADTPAHRRDAIEADLLGWLLGGYRFDRYRSEKEGEEKSAAARLIAPAGAPIEAARRGAAATALARDLVSTPAEDMGPDQLEAAARRLAEEFGAEMTVVEGDALLSQNFPMIHAVGRAAAIAPRLIDLRWGDPGARKITLVGKGVTFDSGGLNLKTGGGDVPHEKRYGRGCECARLGANVHERKRAGPLARSNSGGGERGRRREFSSGRCSP